MKKETRLRVPIHNLGGIVCFGNVGCSPYLLGFCGRNGVAISFLSTYGRFLARAQGRTSGNVLLRREQYRRADSPEHSAEIARAMVAAKIANQRAVVLRALRDHGSDEGALGNTAERLGQCLGDLSRASGLDVFRGIEGLAARHYFETFDHLIRQQKDDFFFTQRSRRPPLDRVNALLSFLYTLLLHDVEAACESVGLDPSVGYLHRDRPGRSGLALDLMEEFRSFLADRLVLTLIHRRQVKPEGFEVTESGAVLMDEATRKTVVTAYQKRKQDELTHPFLEEKTTVGLLPHLQALLLARHLRGDLDAYPPFFTIP